uniref:Uncharacterized protein n=1 Tax=Panagrolaimus sp. PS1159 TaxID=55785 RepID=A0AC35GI63_9BILA
MDQKHSPDSGATLVGTQQQQQQQQQPSCSLPLEGRHIKSESATSQQSDASGRIQRLQHQMPPPEAQLPEESTSSRLPYQNFFGITSQSNSSNFFGQ